jgi:hypothetical protein
VVESGFRRSPGYAETIGDLGQRQIEVVVEDEHGPLLERQPPEGSLQLVAIVDQQDAASLGHSTGRSRMLADQRLRRLASA